MMAEVLGCVMTDKFKAVASISGIVELNYTAADSLKTCDNLVEQSGKSVDVLNVHGTLDPIVPW